jgi:hypothetical protein
MIAFKRDSSGLYLADLPEDARVAFLFQDASRIDPSFDLSASSWVDPGSLGFIAFFLPSGTRDWASFAAGIRSAFEASAGTQIGWFPEPLSIAPTLVAVTGQGTGSPTICAVLLAGVSAKRDIPGSARPVRSDDDGAVR